ncbi:uncharacterized protein LACBIDRAFT_322856 [Laccaria bicolor S238N-H82]|uniref:Predicted protein n=1 Tax=Laccaria bicolor (strain S238N-H82 / ATCC MYA-4686) TaxID=486041 RepID=B0CVC9_LACBS|nr:uncharacterized protein LACBIDRAFT_322856 [Laccaria bicolor S238N-H82]EDR13306.1 predicted protein [Laccaria bicolor S238N-H82]|eukprot:XP_001875804.1 predicted protein [Laccaria bicolor S238N-H82]
MGRAADSLSASKRKKVKIIVENSLETSNVVLTTLNDLASMAPVPYLQQAAGLALGILNIVQGAKDNRDTFQKLAADTCELMYVVLCMSEEAFEEDCGFIDNLQNLLDALSSTKRFLCKEVSRGPAVRLLRCKSDLGQIQEYRDALRRPLDEFVLQSNVAMRKTLLKLERDREKDSEAASGSVPAPAAVDKELPPLPPIVTDETPKPSVTVTHIGGDKFDSHSFNNVTNTESGNITITTTTNSNSDNSHQQYEGNNYPLLQQEILLTTDYTGCGVPVPAAVDEENVPVAPVVSIPFILKDETSKPFVTATHIGGDTVTSYSLSSATDTNSGNKNTMPMFTGVTFSGGNFDDVSEDMVINDSSSHTTNRGSFNTMNSTRNDFSGIMAHNYHAGTVNNYNGAKDVNTGADYGAHPNVVVPAYLISNLTINQNDHRGAMPSREPYALQSHNYQRSRVRGFRPHAYSAPPAGHYYGEQEHHYNDYQRSADGRPGGARRYQDRARYRPTPQGFHPYPVDPRDEEIPSWALGDAYPGDDIYSDEGEGFKPHGAYALSAEGYTPASHPRSKFDSATSTSYASGPSRMKSNNPFRKTFSPRPITPKCS